MNTPGVKDIFSLNPVKIGPDALIKEPTLGGIISALLNIVLIIAVFLTFFWCVWGIFQYIFAGGNKENLGKARGRITWALVGLAVTLIALAVSQYAQKLLPIRENQPITPISIPGAPTPMPEKVCPPGTPPGTPC